MSTGTTISHGTASGTADTTGALHAMHRDTFGALGLEGDPASVALSLRDAHLRLAGDLEGIVTARALDIAERIGDEALARAAGARAFEMGWTGILTRFLQFRPHLAGTVELMRSMTPEPTPPIVTTQQVIGERRQPLSSEPPPWARAHGSGVTQVA